MDTRNTHRPHDQPASGQRESDHQQQPEPLSSWGFLEQAAEMGRRGEEFALATVVWRQPPSSGKEGYRAIITASGQVHGWIGGACAEPAVIREARRAIAEGVPRLLLLGPPGQFGGRAPEGMISIPVSCQSEGALEIYIEPATPAPHLVIVGQSPMARTLAELARSLGWRCDLIAGQDFSSADAGERSMVVVATQGQGDEDAVAEAVAARPAYLGLVGSARKGAAVLGYLAERGVPKERLDRIHVPTGLDLGPTSHREIAVSILAELVKLRASGTPPPAARAPAAGAPVESATADTTRASADGTTAEATDPVCGMTVPAGPSALSHEHEGVTYYFCCAGCRQRFSTEPAAYVKKEI
jgi:xanthine dehydrogenase accessory factor